MKSSPSTRLIEEGVARKKLQMVVISATRLPVKNPENESESVVEVDLARENDTGVIAIVNAVTETIVAAMTNMIDIVKEIGTVIARDTIVTGTEIGEKIGVVIVIEVNVEGIEIAIGTVTETETGMNEESIDVSDLLDAIGAALETEILQASREVVQLQMLTTGAGTLVNVWFA